MHFGLVTKKMAPVFLNGRVMVLNGAYDAEAYGHSCWLRVFWVLGWQQRTLGFLVECCESILHDILTTKITANVFSVVEEPQLGGKVFKDGFASLAAIEEEAPFQLSTRLNVNRIKFAEVREHRQEMLEDTNGDLHPIPKRGKEYIFLTAQFVLRTRGLLQAPSPTKGAPLLQTLLKFRHYLNQAVKGTLTMLGQSVIVSPSMRKS
ncbi:hypothetical protein LZ31DRAFT_595411 [Colletotrichum somersetense]|nr:hypothetical protein LZ31DRAFT_595411 [Colletotrichum somersetense]